jgi:hypothetical protein
MARQEDPTHHSMVVGTLVKVLQGGTAILQHHAPETNDTEDRGGTWSSRTLSRMIKGYFHKTLDKLQGHVKVYLSPSGFEAC